MKDTPIFDGDDLLRRVGGDEEMYRYVLRIFLEECPGQIARIDAAVSAGETAQLIYQAHTLMGSAVNVGACALSGFAQGIEQAARAGDLVRAEKLRPLLLATFEELRKHLDELGLSGGSADG